MPRSFRWFLLSAAAATFFGALPAGKAIASPAPPLTSPATHRHLPGKFVLSQLVTPNLEASTRFYSGLFGWSIHRLGTPERPRAVAYNGREVVALLVEHTLSNPDQPPFWFPFLSSKDADTTTAQSAMLGARVHLDGRNLPALGREAIVVDPRGATFGVLTATAGDPADGDAVVGSWVWSALLSSDPEGAAKFYGSLFGYRIETLDEHHFLASSGEVARATFNVLPPRFPADAPARWVRFVRVLSVGATAEDAVKLGGHIVVPAHPDRDGVMIAIIADPAGAVFGIMELPTDLPQGEAK
ncbi:VOC family protein [Brytella acorum]|uniref:Glyoxalase n=1 Tax=Brytella acorum TaxID=2959299 RepID=A0AA35UWG0_9PROT|nr:VOC family protein [Brytella acorum]MDF3624583.1 glyoxalase [Brytella acorum]CAI9120939.1 glyoxalase [Brytella acorum]